jgi:tetratricopeptide (TPR) repeat protein
MTKRFHTILLFILLAGFASPAFAQDIVELNEKGIAAFQEGRFADAASFFQQAYGVEAQPPLKKNEAAAWFKAGKCPEAINAAKQYLALDTGVEISVKETRAILVDCNVQLAKTATDEGALEAAEGHLTEAEAHQPDAEAAAKIAAARTAIAEKKEEQRLAREKALAEAEAKREAEQKAARRARMRTVGLGVAGGGAAILLGTLVYHSAMAFGTAPRFKDTAAAGEDRATYDRLGRRLETANWLIPTLYGVGLAAGGAGAYLWWSNGALGSERPQAASREVGVQIVWRY